MTTMVTRDQLVLEANVRLDTGDVTGLAESIAANGVITPLTVRPNGSDGTFYVTAGHRRLAAIDLLLEQGAWTTQSEIPVFVRIEETDADRIVTQVVENLQREALDPIEEGLAYHALTEAGRSQRDIAHQVGVNQSTVSRRLALLKLSTSAQALVRTGALDPDLGVLMAKLPHEVQDELVAAGRIDSWAIEQAIERVKQEHELAKLVKAVEKAGYVLVEPDEVPEDWGVKDTFRSVEEVTEVVPTGEGQPVLIGRLTYSGPCIMLMGKKRAPKNADEAAAAKEKLDRKAARLGRKAYLDSLRKLVSRQTPAKLAPLVFELYAPTTPTSAKQICEVLDLEPVQTAEGKPDYQATVMAWAGMDPKGRAQVAAAILFAERSYNEPIKAVLAEAGIEPEDQVVRRIRAELETEQA